MKKLFISLLSLALAVVLGVGSYAANAEGAKNVDPSIIKDIKMGVWDNDTDKNIPNNIIGKDEATIFHEAKERWQVDLDYNKSSGLTINEGDTLSISIKPEDASKDFVSIDYKSSVLKSLMDNSKNPPIKIADIDLKSRQDIKLKFQNIDIFKAHIDLGLTIKDKDALYKYFRDNPDAKYVDSVYYIYKNGDKSENSKIRYRFNKPVPPKETKYTKTNGIYNLENTLGEGTMLYNIYLQSLLRSPNEYIIYDAPDVGLGFEGNISIKTGPFEGSHANDIYPTPWDSSIKVKVYDVYYETVEGNESNGNRHAEWEEKTVTFNRNNVYGEKLDSMGTVKVPKNILFEKPTGEALTQAEKDKIEAKGGLYKTIGKGFKVTISDYKDAIMSPGGNLTLIYSFKIQEPSKNLNKDGNTEYYNTFTYYAQEIPTCDPKKDENCIPISFEKTGLKDKKEYGTPEYPAKGIVKPPTVGGEIKIPAMEFTKVEAGSGKALEGAKFTIYNSNRNNEKLGIAKTEDGIMLEDLVTDSNGKLSKNGNAIALKLKNAYYICSEISAPDGYEIVNADTPFTIGYKAVELKIENKKSGNDNPENPENPDNPENPEKPDNPVPNTKAPIMNKVPQTGDAGIGIWIAIMVLAVIIVILVVYRNKKQSKNK